jgi:hypothetical protein
MWLVNNLGLSNVPRLITPHVEPQPQPRQHAEVLNNVIMASISKQKTKDAPQMSPQQHGEQQDHRNIPQTSSYWSVPEATDLPALLRHFGTDWHGIAKHLTTKTHIMVYTTIFQQWLAMPSDNNKSRRIANI